MQALSFESLKRIFSGASLRESEHSCFQDDLGRPFEAKHVLVTRVFLSRPIPHICNNLFGCRANILGRSFASESMSSNISYLCFSLKDDG